MKYTARLHANANSDKVKFIGDVKGDSIKEIKENARKHARNWNERGRIHVEIEETGHDFFVNA
jgi:hypothetical protein